MSLPQKFLLLALLSAACGGPTGQGPTTTGITTVTLTTGISTNSSSQDPTGSSSEGPASTSSGTESAPGASGTSTGGEPDLPGSDTSEPVKGCGKIDILFVINDAGEADDADSKADALNIRSGTEAFIAAMQEQAAGYDLHVMSVKGDPSFGGSNGWSGCCSPGEWCNHYGPFPCSLI